MKEIHPGVDTGRTCLPQMPGRDALWVLPFNQAACGADDLV
jgi:hypothetical protein